MDDHAPARRRFLRSAVVVALVLGTAITVLAGVDGRLVYTPQHELLGAAPVAQHQARVAILLLVILAPALFVWRRPLLRHALAWSVWTVAVAWLSLLWTSEPSEHPALVIVDQWPAELYGTLLVALLASFVAILPLGCLAFAAFTRGVPAPPVPPASPELPAARIVTRRA